MGKIGKEKQMTRILSKKTKQYRIIKDCVDAGISGNKIQKLLQENGLGVRRKKLYAEIRAIKGKELFKEKSKKSIPKKYRKEEKEPVKKWKKRGFGFGYIYRGSLIISSVPLHSTPFSRHYLGFRLNIFSYDKNVVYNALRNMKKQFIRMVGDRLRSLPYADEQVMGTEKPTKINVTNPDSLNGKWFFAVEEKGSDIDSESGYI